MSTITSQIYRIVVPKFIRKRILAKELRLAILNHYDALPEAPSTELKTVLDYLRTNPIAVFPYSFQNKYNPETIEVFKDSQKGLRYVMLEGKKLYFKRRWSKKRIQHSFIDLTREQYL